VAEREKACLFDGRLFSFSGTRCPAVKPAPSSIAGRVTFMPEVVRQQKNPTILIVDDDKFMRVTIQDILREAGFLTVTAPNGLSAIASFRDNHPDLVILDLIMPGMDGFQTCQAMRGLPGGKYAPVLMITSMEDEESIHRAFEAGATDFISKPINPGLLVYRLRYMLKAARSMKDLAGSETRLRMLKEAVECLPMGITLSGVDGRIIYANPAEAEIHGYTTDELIGRDARQFAPSHFRKPVRPDQDSIWCWRRESVNIRKTGEEFPVQLISTAVKDSRGRYLGTVTACEDISKRKEVEERLHQLAFTDALTGLPNRGTFLDRLHHALNLARRKKSRVGLLFLDLDNFKDVNDTQGHDFGDKLLKDVAGRLATCMRESDTLARLGGDEFVVILTSVTGQENAEAAARRILSIFATPFEIDGRKIFTSVSIGIALYPDDGPDAEILYKCADTAMYHAKTERKANFRFFSPEMNHHLMRRVALESSLRQGLEKQEFYLHYQPQWDLKTARMIGVEVLLRWQSAEFGLLPPAEFITLAENSGIIFGLGEWVLRTAFIQARNWALAGHRDLKVAVNISGLQFKHPDFLADMERLIRETGVGPETLELEFTESVVMEKADKTITTLQSLKKMGIRLSIDDFGTGYSSLSYLKHFPIDRIKIDRSFVADINRSKDDAAIVEAIISMAHSLNLRVVAEGVEDRDQLRFLEARNCDEVQGFYLAKPMSAEELVPTLGGVLKKRTYRHPEYGMFDYSPVSAE
jgi:diguanylate cyclase (GGDEF)-like protein/PAS domain S-box-containing protein